MEKQELIEKLHPIFREILENDEITLSEHTTAKDIDEWDSLNHIQLIVAIEKKFGIQFTSSEIQSWKTVGEMCDSINKYI